MYEVETQSTIVAPLTVEKISFEDYLKKYDGQHAEWINGKVELRMSASDKHQDLSDFFVTLLRFWTEAKNAGVIRSAPLTMKISKLRRGREPDILFLAKENLHRLKPTFVDGAADLIIEIISPESRERDRVEKFGEYQIAGVREYWLIDPELRAAEFYALNENDIYELLNDEPDGVFRSRILPELFLKTEWLWREPLPPVIEVLKEWKLF